MRNNQKLQKAKYYGLSARDIMNIISSYLHYSQYNECIWKVTDNYFDSFDGWWDEYIADEEEYRLKKGKKKSKKKGKKK
jgi:hypothetical protein